MNTQSKFLRFGFGFLLGVFMLLIMFGDRDFSCVGDYFPEGRVIQNIKTKKIIFPENLPNKYKRLTDSIYLNNIFFKNASVIFDKSDQHKKPCGEYFITNDTISLLIKNCEDQVEVLHIE